MRVAPVGNFRKLWGRIEENLPKGEYVIKIKNSNFPNFCFLCSNATFKIMMLVYLAGQRA